MPVKSARRHGRAVLQEIVVPRADLAPTPIDIDPHLGTEELPPVSQRPGTVSPPQAMKWNAVWVSSIGTCWIAMLYRLFGGISTVNGAMNSVVRTYMWVASLTIGRRIAA